MKTNLSIFIILIFAFQCFEAQISTEAFEDEIQDSIYFTDQGQQFKIISYVSTFDIQTNYPGTGWNGTSVDNNYIDNTGTAKMGTNPKLGIKTNNGNSFKLKSFWIYVTRYNLDHNITGTLTVTGKLAGITKFAVSKSSGFAASDSQNNGHTLLDFSILGGIDNTNILIDELVIESSGTMEYIDIDAFKWEKVSTLEVQDRLDNSLTKAYPNPTSGIFFLEGVKSELVEIYNYAGLLVKKVNLKNIKSEVDITDLPTGSYIVKTGNRSFNIIKK